MPPPVELVSLAVKFESLLIYLEIFSISDKSASIAVVLEESKADGMLYPCEK